MVTTTTIPGKEIGAMLGFFFTTSTCRYLRVLGFSALDSQDRNTSPMI
jgi:hypothetical protein